MALFDIFKKKSEPAAAGQPEMAKREQEELSAGLEKTKSGLFSKLARAVAGRSTVDADVLDDLEEVLITSDVGVETTVKIIRRIEERAARDKYMNASELRTILREEIAALLEQAQGPNDGCGPDIRPGSPYVIMVVGVNGAGKTTTIGKLASRLTKAGRKVWIGAADTFRAAAIDQLKVWADRAGATMIRQEMGSDPASVAFDTLTSAKANGADVVLIDTAGRLHNKVGLMNELTKIRNVMAKVIPDARSDARARRLHRAERLRTGQAVHPGHAGHLAGHHQARRHGQGRRGNRHQRPFRRAGALHWHRRRRRPAQGLRPSRIRQRPFRQ